MNNDHIRIQGARQHNLKNIHCIIPRNHLVVITGLSGSGKSSLAFDTIYAEGQRRYVESLSAYARQFLELMDKPDVDIIEGLSPAISIEQRNPSRNPRSTVGTVTEIYDYLRLLYARIGIPHCPSCGRRIQRQSVQDIVAELLTLPKETKLQIYAPLVRGRKGEYRELFERLLKMGFSRVRVDGQMFSLEETITLQKYKKHTIELLVDQLMINPDDRERLTEAVSISLREARGLVLAESLEKKKNKPVYQSMFSEHHSCAYCGLSLPEIEPRLFSFNSPHGACPDCSGLGMKIEIDESLIVPDPRLSIEQGALKPWANPITTRTHRWKASWSGYYGEMLHDVCTRHRIPTDIPYTKLSRSQKNTLLYGDDAFEGVLSNMQRRYQETESDYVREAIMDTYMLRHQCPTCHGARLKKEALAVTVGGLSIDKLVKKSIAKAQQFFKDIVLSDKEKLIARQILKEINARLGFLVNVGLDYITLDRESGTLSGGEAQRIHLATQIGSGLVGVLYVLDEPTIGLHQRDNRRLISTLVKLRDLGNTLIIVEHDEETIRKADYVIDLGPGAGEQGGSIVAQGTPAEIMKNKHSLTGKYLSGDVFIQVPSRRRQPADHSLVIHGAQQFNLKNLTVDIPLGLFVCVTGVSGSGKSTLVYEILYKALAQKLYHAKDTPGVFRSIKGFEYIDKVIVVDQSPIGRTPRSNPATYTGVFSPIRDLFAELPESKRRGYKPGRFSFNVKGGRCENCQGDGTIKIEMQFLSDVYIPCDRCNGKRFNDETLEIRYKGKNIAEVLGMSVDDALKFFENIPKAKRIIQTLYDVGLGYIRLGQPATTLSGGEAQRVKLASELCSRSTGRTLYILDEPTTGLHFADVGKLLEVLHRLVSQGNTVLVIEHNLDVIKTADWIIDLGPDGGDAGGYVVSAGTPEQIAGHRKSYTGQYLKSVLGRTVAV
ncbi:MAG: excinuclease ABC subunit UvrA [Elusimicrobia bacterium]|nr:excinuclease ABC subunit UvrA [Elusimicrobiota bacterium]MBD3411689.1 excinuclease ABC subunit UvrA [Elusimicrobiota bacterium]